FHFLLVSSSGGRQEFQSTPIQRLVRFPLPECVGLDKFATQEPVGPVRRLLERRRGGERVHGAQCDSETLGKSHPRNRNLRRFHKDPSKLRPGDIREGVRRWRMSLYCDSLLRILPERCRQRGLFRQSIIACLNSWYVGVIAHLATSTSLRRLCRLVLRFT